MKSICKVRPRLEGFLGRFFLVQLVFWLQALNAMAAPAHHRHHEASRGFTGPHGGTGHHWASWRRRASRGPTGPHGGTGHHGASWRRRASRGFTAAQDLTAPHGGTGHH